MTMKFRVAFQGEHGAFSEQASHEYFSKTTATLPIKTFEGVFSSVKRGTARYGIIPIENSLFGSIHQNYDLLQQFDVKIVGEVKLRIVHALMVQPRVTLKDIKYVYSHPQALGQCDQFLRGLKGVDTVAMYDTAGAAKMIGDNRRTDAAAIASVEAAKVYGLRILCAGIENDHKNFTRFLVLGKRSRVQRKNAKTSIIFSLKNDPGALFKALSVFALREINLYKIESRPLVGKPWEYTFYLDFKGSVEDEVCKNALDHLREIAAYIKILGSYPEGKTVSRISS